MVWHDVMWYGMMWQKIMWYDTMWRDKRQDGIWDETKRSALHYCMMYDPLLSVPVHVSWRVTGINNPDQDEDCYRCCAFPCRTHTNTHCAIHWLHTHTLSLPHLTPLPLSFSVCFSLCLCLCLTLSHTHSIALALQATPRPVWSLLQQRTTACPSYLSRALTCTPRT